MSREEFIIKLNTVINNLNDDGLALMNYFVGNMHEIEKYNINTSPEKIAEIEEKEAKCRETERKAKEQIAFKRMQEENEKRKNIISSLEGREKILWNKIEKVQRMNITRYSMKSGDVFFLAKLYDNNFLDGCCAVFNFGFYQGMQYMKNRAGKEV